jgi:hypothetical protein
VVETHQPGQIGSVISVARLSDEYYKYETKPRITNSAITLDPDSEFERALMSLVKTHRVKSKGYGSESDPYQNFLDNSWMNSVSPLLACEILLNKHQSFLRQWRARTHNTAVVTATEMVPHTDGSDDAMLDRAVYSVIALCLYNREVHNSELATQES